MALVFIPIITKKAPIEDVAEVYYSTNLPIANSIRVLNHLNSFVGIADQLMIKPPHMAIVRLIRAGIQEELSVMYFSNKVNDR